MNDPKASSAISSAALVLPEAVWSGLLDQLPRAANLDEAMCLIEAVRQSQLGNGLLTVNFNTSLAGTDPSADTDICLQRIWTSNPTAYPVAGRKRKSLTPWTQKLLLDAQVFIGEGETTLKQIFDDHTLIATLGLRCVVNVPVLDEDGECIATFNVLGTQEQWEPSEVALIQLLASLATAHVRIATRALPT